MKSCHFDGLGMEGEARRGSLLCHTKGWGQGKKIGPGALWPMSPV